MAMALIPAEFKNTFAKKKSDYSQILKSKL